MSFDLKKMLDSKRALRQKLASKPLVEKMRLLEQLNERTLVIKRPCNDNQPSIE